MQDIKCKVLKMKTTSSSLLIHKQIITTAIDAITNKESNHWINLSIDQALEKWLLKPSYH